MSNSFQFSENYVVISECWVTLWDDIEFNSITILTCKFNRHRNFLFQIKDQFSVKSFLNEGATAVVSSSLI